jgi:small GTP-binding protein
MLQDNRLHIKLILLGDVGVGKSSIIQRYNENKFKEGSSSTLNSYFIEKEVKIQEEDIILELWDTAGQEQFRSITKIFVKNSKVILLVYDVTSRKSFESVTYWHDYIIKELGPNIILGLAANKIDLIAEDDYEGNINPEEGIEYASKIGATFAQVSAKESSKEIVNLINKLLIRYLESKDNNPSILNSTIKLDDRTNVTEVDKSNECCSGKKKNTIKLKTIFLGDDGVGKTAIIKAIKGKENFSNLAHTKKEYIEDIYYKKMGRRINVELKEINVNEFENHNSDINNEEYKLIFLVFDINRKETLFDLNNFVIKLGLKNKIYLLGYNKQINGDQNTEFNYDEEAELFAKKYGCEYEYITIEDIYKIKAIIIDNIGKYLLTLGYK